MVLTVQYLLNKNSCCSVVRRNLLNVSVCCHVHVCRGELLLGHVSVLLREEREYSYNLAKICLIDQVVYFYFLSKEPKLNSMKLLFDQTNLVLLSARWFCFITKIKVPKN